MYDPNSFGYAKTNILILLTLKNECWDLYNCFGFILILLVSIKKLVLLKEQSIRKNISWNGHSLAKFMLV